MAQVELLRRVGAGAVQMAWPGHIPEGMRVREVVSLVDMVASFLEAGGAPT